LPPSYKTVTHIAAFSSCFNSKSRSSTSLKAATKD
jgi:hypothetical protein